jgi:hypothetical protein
METKDKQANKTRTKRVYVKVLIITNMAKA